MSVIMDETIVKEEKNAVVESKSNEIEIQELEIENTIDMDNLDILDKNEDDLSNIENNSSSDNLEEIESIDSKDSVEDISDSEKIEENSSEESEEISMDEDEIIEVENKEIDNSKTDSNEIVEEVVEEQTENNNEEKEKSESKIKLEDDNKDHEKQKRQNKVVLKGVKDGLLIILPDDIPWNETVNDLAEILDKDKSFWIGASTSVEVGKHSLDETQIKRLSDMLVKRYNLLLAGVYSEDEKTIESSHKNELKTGDLYTSLAKNIHSHQKEEEIKQPVQTDSAEIVQNTVVGNAMYLKQTVRSGQSVRFDGNVIIYGDTNPGSEIIASGDIVILGTLRGIAHAGARGDESCQIIATNLKASQLRIASCIGMSGDDDNKSLSYNGPEYACIVDGKIFIGALKSKR